MMGCGKLEEADLLIQSSESGLGKKNNLDKRLIKRDIIVIALK
jgi:hypothetical protein